MADASDPVPHGAGSPSFWAGGASVQELKLSTAVDSSASADRPLPALAGSTLLRGARRPSFHG